MERRVFHHHWSQGKQGCTNFSFFQSFKTRNLGPSFPKILPSPSCHQSHRVNAFCTVASLHSIVSLYPATTPHRWQHLLALGCVLIHVSSFILPCNLCPAPWGPELLSSHLIKSVFSFFMSVLRCSHHHTTNNLTAELEMLASSSSPASTCNHRIFWKIQVPLTNPIK